MSKTIFIIAGEASGDNVGARFIQAVSNIDPSIEFVGIGGEMMIEAGLKSVFPLRDISAIGIVEVFSKLFTIIKKLKITVESIKKIKPEAIITIDFSGFNDRVAKRIKKQGIHIPVVRYVAPPVWAWRPWRAKKMPAYIDYLLTLFKFEPPLFEKYGLKSSFVGHPVLEDEDLAKPSDKEINDFCAKYNIKKSDPLICLLPGSRKTEIEHHTKIFLDTIKLLKRDIPNLQVFIPTFKDYVEYIKDAVGDCRFPISINRRDKGIAMHIATCALVAAGTVTLELAFTKTPMIVSYRVNPVTAFIVKRLINVQNVSLVNILLKSSVVPELLQEECTATRLYKETLQLITDHSLQKQQLIAFEKISDLITFSGNFTVPSEKAAQYIMDYLNNHQKELNHP